MAVSWAPEYDHVFRLLDPSRIRRCKDYWMAPCPAHEDDHPSLKIQAGKDGLLLFCNAGAACTFREIHAALSRRAGKSVCLRPWGDRAEDYEMTPTLKIAKAYDYTDENRILLYQTVRLDPKDFRQRRPKDPGFIPAEADSESWYWDLQGCRNVPYRLPELAKVMRDERLKAPEKRKWIGVFEGEKDADTAAGLGIVATTCVGGAGKWHQTELKHFDGARVAVFFDMDPVWSAQGKPRDRGLTAGMLNVLQLAGLLHGKAYCVRPVRLSADGPREPGAPSFDFTGWVEWLKANEPDTDPRRAAYARVVESYDWDPWGPKVGPNPSAYFDRVLKWADQYKANGPMRGVKECLELVQVQITALARQLVELQDENRQMKPEEDHRGDALLRMELAAAACLRAYEDLKMAEETASRKEA